MGQSKYTLEEAIAKLKKKRVKIGSTTDEITNLAYNFVDVSSADNLGITSWGLIDFLCHYYGYRLIKPITTATRLIK